MEKFEYSKSGYPYAPIKKADTKIKISDYIKNEKLMATPMFREEGFLVFNEIREGPAFKTDIIKASIDAYKSGEWTDPMPSVYTQQFWEWGYALTHAPNGENVWYGGQRMICNFEGDKAPKTRKEAVQKIHDYLIECFIKHNGTKEAPHPWLSVNGHYPWHHYAGEAGFDAFGSEIGENINNYQWHIALTRGVARQYQGPWCMDFSPWHGPSVTSYIENTGYGSDVTTGPDAGHSMNLFKRAMLMSMMAGANVIQAEAGGCFSFYPEIENGIYKITPYGLVMCELQKFAKAHPDRGQTITPFAIVLDYYHGAYSGFEGRKSFYHFPYNDGDNMTWDLVDKIWPGGWETIGRNELDVMVNNIYGDNFDVLLQNASQEILNCYPAIILSGDIKLSTEEIKRYKEYAEQGGKLILNTAYLKFFEGYKNENIIVYGPDYSVENMDAIIKDILAKEIPFTFSTEIEYIVNVKNGSFIVTLINNDGVMKKPTEIPIIDESKRKTITVTYTGDLPIQSCSDIYNNNDVTVNGKSVSITVEAGGVSILEFVFG